MLDFGITINKYFKNSVLKMDKETKEDNDKEEKKMIQGQKEILTKRKIYFLKESRNYRANSYKITKVEKSMEEVLNQT